MARNAAERKDDLSEFVVALITFVLSVVGTYVTTRRNLELQYDSDLRRDRIETYRKLWGHLSTLNKYGGRPDVGFNRTDASSLAVTLKQWYFDTGGIFLSVDTRQRYFALQDGLRDVIAASSDPDDAFDYLRVLGSRLRTSMTRDVGTRKTFKFRGDGERFDASRAAGEYTRAGAGLRISFRPGAIARRWTRTTPTLLTSQGDGAWRSLNIEHWDRDDREIVAHDPARPDERPRRLLVEADETLVELPDLQDAAGAPEPSVWRKVERPPPSGKHG